MWIDLKTLSTSINKSLRLVQKIVQEDTSIERRINGKKTEVLLSSLPSSWQEALTKPSVVIPSSLQAGNLTNAQRQKSLIAQMFKNCPPGVNKSEWTYKVAKYFDVSESTVRRTVAEVEAYGPIGKPRGLNANVRWDDEAIQFLQGYYLAAIKSHGTCSKSTAWTMCQRQAKAKGWSIGSRTSAYEILAGITPLMIAFAKGGNRALDNYFFITRNKENLAPMQIVIGDQHIFDFWIADYDKGLIRRPECYLWIDMSTKVIYGIAFDVHYSSYTVKEALRIGLTRFGLFDCTYNDNGSSECSKATNAIVDDLIRYGANMQDISELYKTDDGVYVVEDDSGEILETADTVKEWKRKHRRIFANVKNAKAKDIERFFRTLEARLDARMIPGRVATLGAPADIDEEERKRLFEAKKNLSLLTEEEFIRVVLEELDAYEHTPHSALKGLTPTEAITKKFVDGWRPRLLDETAINLILAERRIAKVQRGRVLINGIWYWSDEVSTNTDSLILDKGLFAQDGKSVEVRYNKYDPSVAWAIIDNEVRLLTTVQSIEMLNDEDMKKAVEKKRKQMKAIRDVFKQTTNMVGEITYKTPLIEAAKPAAIEESTEEQKPTKNSNARPIKSAIHMSKRERYKWCLEMLISGAGLDPKDEAFIQEYKVSSEYREYEEYWNSLEKKVR